MKQLFFTLSFFTSLCITSQEPAYYMVGKEVLAGLNLYSIIQDDTDDSMWITAENGIYNYNGHKFTYQLPKNIAGSSLFGLTKDAYKNIYCFNLNGQIFKIRNKKLELFYTIPKEYIGSTTKIVFDDKNNLLVFTNKNVYILKNNFLHNIENSVHQMAKFNNVVFFQKITKEKRQIVTYKNGEKNILHTSKNNNNLVFNTFFYKKNTLFAHDVDESKIISFSNKGIRKEIPLGFTKNKNPFRLYVTKGNMWFVNHKNGVYKIDTIPKLTKNHSLLFKDHYISGALVDKEENTWLLTFDKGIIIIPNKNVISYAKTFKNDAILSINKNNNHIFLGSLKGNIYKLKNGKPKLYQSNLQKLEYFKVYDKENISITNNHMYRNKRNPVILGAFVRYSEKISDSIFNLSANYGVFRYNINKKTIINLNKKRSYYSYFDHKTKKTWIASSIGLQQYYNNTLVEKTHNGNTILASTIVPIKNEIWVSSNKGVHIFKNDSIIKTFTCKTGLLHRSVRKIVYEAPFVYLATRNAIQQYNIQTKTFKNFTQANGLNGAINNFEILNDTIYTVTSNNLLRFTFNDLKKLTKKYTTNITSAIANGTKSIKNNAILNPEENNIEFSFLTPTFTHKKNVEYQYKLTNIDKSFTVAKENQYYEKYKNLPAGTYTFTVKSSINSVENLPANINFTIRPYWYKTNWFKFLVIGLGLLMAYSIYKIRLNAILRKRYEENMQKRLAESSLTSLKAQMNPHFLFNAMNSIQSLILSDQKDEAYQYLTRLSNLVRENLKMSDVSFVAFVDELKLIKKYLELEKLRFTKTLTYQIIDNITEKEVKIPSMIVQPFVENAIKHGLLHKKNNRKLLIEFFQDEETIHCIITDNGIGRKASQEIQKRRKHKSFSTNAIQKRFDILREYYNIDIGFSYEDLYEENEATGTKVTIKIPYSNEFS